MENKKRLIDANAVLRRMNKRREDFADCWKTLDDMPDGAKCKYEENLKCALMIEDAPTVDAVEVVHGRFESVRYGYGCCKIATCSACGYKNGLYINGRVPDWNYCPNCGAKMDGDGNA